MKASFFVPRPRAAVILALIIVMAVVLRLGVAFYLGDSTPPGKDETSYSLLAWRLAQGYGYTFPQDWYPGFVPAGAPTAHWSFLYTAFAAGIYRIGGFHPLWVRLAGALLTGILLPWMMVRLGRRVWPERPDLALVAAALAGAYAYFVLFGAMVQTEGLFIITTLWSLERALAFSQSLYRANFSATHFLVVVLGLGSSLGLATLLRQSILPWVAVLFILLLATGIRGGHGRRTLAGLVGAGLVLLVFVLPWTWRNYRAYGDFLLLNSNAGYALYSAQHPMHGDDFEAFAAAPLPTDLRPPPQNEAQWDRALFARGLSFIVAEPGRYAWLSLSRAADYFKFWPSRETSLVNNAGRMLSFALFLPAMVYGLWLSRREWRRFWLLYAFVLFYSMLHLLTWAMIRYRLPVDAVLLLFAALAILHLASRLRRRGQRAGEPAQVSNSAA